VNVKLTFKAALFSPWATAPYVLLVLSGLLFSNDSGFSTELASQIPGTLFLFLIFAFKSAFAAYPLVICVGIPVHWVFSKLDINQWYSYVGVGLCIGLFWCHCFYVSSDMPVGLKEAAYGAYAFNSLLVSAVFWYIAVNPHNKHRQQGRPNRPPLL